MHRLISTAVPQPPAPPVEADPYDRGYADGYAAALWGRVEGPVLFIPERPVPWLAEAVAPDPTADKAQLAALGAASQRGDQGR